MNWSNRIRERDLTVGVLGMGYVGLPLALSFAEAGYDVVGFDTDESRIRTLKKADSPIPDLDASRLESAVSDSNFSISGDMRQIESLDVVSICVPTPLRKSRDPDISYVVEATETVTDYFRPPGIVVLESTTYPGTTEELLGEEFEAAGWDLQQDVHLAFSPERIDPANEEYTIRNTPKVVGGLTDRATRLAGQLYGQIVDEIIKVSDTRSAEMVKLLENTFRSINIGLANEMALICDQLEIDVWEVIDAAATKPYGFMPFYPGPGLGGHCIPVDPLFLSWRARLANTQSRFIELADQINRSMPDHVVSKITEGLNEKAQPVKGSHICLFGVAYKSNVNDVRESPANEIVDRLRDLGARITYCDPYVESFSVNRNPVHKINRAEVPNRSFDAGVIVTAHDGFKWDNLLESCRVVVDTRNALGDDSSVTSLVLTL